MAMFQVQRRRAVRSCLGSAAVFAAVGLGLVAAPSARADNDDDAGATIEGKGHKVGLYPIAVPVVTEGDAAAGKQVAEIASFDFSVAGVFKVLDPASFLDTQSTALSIDPQKWKDVGAFGVMKYKASGDVIEFALFDVAKGDTPVLTDKIARRGDIR